MLQDAGRQLGGAAAVVAVDAPAALDAHLESVGHAAQLLRQVAQALAAYTIHLGSAQRQSPVKGEAPKPPRLLHSTSICACCVNAPLLPMVL